MLFRSNNAGGFEIVDVKAPLLIEKKAYIGQGLYISGSGGNNWGGALVVDAKAGPALSILSSGSVTFESINGSSNTFTNNLTSSFNGSVTVNSTLKSTNSFTQAKMSGSQIVTAGSDTTVQFNLIDINNNGWFNTSTNTFQPTVSGVYEISFAIAVDTGTSNGQMNAQINKNNGTQIFIIQDEINKNISHTLQGSVLVNFNGSSDNVKITFYTSSGNGSQTILGGNSCFFKAVLL